nr:hypothetical protein [Tanacetum cinerariifolium]
MNTAGQSWNKHSTLEVDRIGHQSLAVGNGSLPRQSIRCPCYGCST